LPPDSASDSFAFDDADNVDDQLETNGDSETVEKLNVEGKAHTRKNYNIIPKVAIKARISVSSILVRILTRVPEIQDQCSGEAGPAISCNLV
jgi:hypothetical protein